MVVLAGLVALASYFTVTKINKKVEKEEVNTYICEILEAQIDSGIMAMRCMVKQ